MALDTGGVTSLYRTGEYDPSAAVGGDAPTLHDGPDLGAALKAVRLFHGVTLQDLADATRIRQTYLAALEDMRLEELPSRPFAVGYVKAYARHLGLDADAAVERFRQEHPDHEEGLRAPVGIRKQRDSRLGLILTFGVLVIVAIVLWNLAQRAISAQASPAKPTIAAPPPAPATDEAGPIQVGGSLPPPVESTTPALYETPGLADSTDGSADAVDAAAKARLGETAQPAALSMPIGSPFKARGPVHGAPAGPGATDVVIQARRNGVFEVRGADGVSYFTRVLQAGEAYRVPALKGLSITVSDPAVFDVFVAGRYTGPLPATVSRADTLAPKAP
ncbi:MAG TPA: RodZ domain-containing protein [Caulobacter sp.]|nr:RodZ domain-containing protein [Caulobacter sp.]